MKISSLGSFCLGQHFVAMRFSVILIISGYQIMTTWKWQSALLFWTVQDRQGRVVNPPAGFVFYIYVLNSISVLTPLGSRRSPDIAPENSAEEEISVCPGKRHLGMFRAMKWTLHTYKIQRKEKNLQGIWTKQVFLPSCVYQGWNYPSNFVFIPWFWTHSL